MLDNGIKSPIINDSAKTRFANDRTKAAQLSMQSGAAKGALRPKKQGSQRPIQPPVGKSQAPQVNQVPQAAPIIGDQLDMGVLKNAVLPEPDPMEMMLAQIQEVNQNIEFEKFISSPLVESAVTKIKLQNHFKRNRPDLQDNKTSAERLLLILPDLG